METKFWLKSKTIWGAIVMILSLAVQLLGWTTVTAEEQAQLTDNLPAIATVGAEIIGIILVIIGRIKAKTVIH